jgi:hypothetical protein
MGLLLNTSRALRLSGLIDGEQFARCQWQLIGFDSAPSEDIVGGHHGRHGIRPAGVEREMRDDLRNFGWLDPIVEREIEMVRRLDRPIARDQSSEGHHAAVASR